MPLRTHRRLTAALAFMQAAGGEGCNCHRIHSWHWAGHRTSPGLRGGCWASVALVVLPPQGPGMPSTGTGNRHPAVLLAAAAFTSLTFQLTSLQPNQLAPCMRACLVPAAGRPCGGVVSQAAERGGDRAAAACRGAAGGGHRMPRGGWRRDQGKSGLGSAAGPLALCCLRACLAVPPLQAVGFIGALLGWAYTRVPLLDAV